VIFGRLPAGPTTTAYAWGNGGYSADANNPRYGTHDFIAHHALDWVPDELDFWIRANLSAYLYGTELPDNANAPAGDGIGDTSKHHVYFRSDGSLQDGIAAVRATETYDRTLAFLGSADYGNAARWMGITTHYVADVAVFGHVMGSATDWGAETHHSDYENWVGARTNRYNATFAACLSFDGQLESITAYNATLHVAHDTTFDERGRGLTAKWMDDNYNTTDPTFLSRVCESINLATNMIADLIYAIAVETGIPEYSPSHVTVSALIALSLVAVFAPRKTSFIRKDSSGKSTVFNSERRKT
jgi:hypothetical protein